MNRWILLLKPILRYILTKLNLNKILEEKRKQNFVIYLWDRNYYSTLQTRKFILGNVDETFRGDGDVIWSFPAIPKAQAFCFYARGLGIGVWSDGHKNGCGQLPAPYKRLSAFSVLRIGFPLFIHQTGNLAIICDFTTLYCTLFQVLRYLCHNDTLLFS